MRILAIRGQNLASLPRFAVDLTAPPLNRAGLFAITGPTGAGKSTLLDALCLALYDKTPRLSARGGAEIGRADDPHKLTAHDVRGLLRRGAGEGFAEVDFIGTDDLRYRARWSVHRARNRADGKFQNQRVDLYLLDEDGAQERALTTDKKTDTLARIEQAVGLNFDEFCRSVLLAQGQFDAFLRANAKDRGALLERMTGTDLYARLSIAAHQRRREREAALAQLMTRLDDCPVLDDDARRALERTAAAATGWLDAARRRATDLQGMQRWYRELRQLAEGEAQAQSDLDEAETRVDESEPRRAQVAAVEKAEPLREPLRRHDEAVAAADVATRDLAAQAEARSTAEAARSRTQSARAAAETDREAARAESAALAPAVAQARALDATRVEAARRVQEAAAAQRGAAAAHLRVHSKYETERQALDAHDAVIAEAQGWLEAHAASRTLAEQWPHWARELDRLTRAREALSGAEVARAGDASALSAARAAVEAAEARREEAAQAWETARARVGAERSEATQAEARAAQAALDAVNARDTQLRNLLDRAREAARARQAQEEERAARAEALAEIRRGQQEHNRLARTLAELSERLTEARRVARAAEAAFGLASHRAALREGEPCPLCGSTEHPGGVAADAATVDAQRERVDDLNEERVEAEAEQARVGERINASRRRAAEAEARQAAASAALARIATDWALARMAVGADVPEDPCDPAAQAALARRVEALDTERAAASARVENARAAQAALDADRARVDHERQQLDEITSALQVRQTALQAAVEADREHLRAADAARRDADETMAELDGAFCDWPDWPEAAEHLEAFIERCEREVDEWQFRVRRREQAQVARREAERALAEQAAERRQRADALHVADKALTAAREAARAADDARAAVLDGRSADAVEADLRRRAEAAEQAVDAARAADERAGAAVSAAAALHAAAESRRDEAARHAGEAIAALRASLTGAGLDEATLRARLAHGPDWVRTQHEHFRRLDDAANAARVRLAERHRMRQAHEARGRPAIASDAVEGHLISVQTAVAAFTEAEGEARLALRQDDEQHRRRAEFAPRIAEAEADFALWDQLNDVIGSHDGSAFRDFAQSLTLEAVVGLANHHLRELAPRYALMRVPEANLELQVVDQHMGDEIRAVQSLSGGESFLVSLSLALGLASLSARNTRLLSLFIDEGFGTLDADTLDTMIATLEALQQSGGRQVGVISHVPSLADRIGVQIRVEPASPGQSRVRVLGVGDGG